MKLLFGIAMFSFILLGFISVIGLIWSCFKKKQKKSWLLFISINAALFLGSVALYNSLLSPEEKSAIADQREQKKVERERQKDADRFRISPQPTQNTSPRAPVLLSDGSVLTSIASQSLGKDFLKIEINDFVDDSTKKIILVHYNGAAGWDNEMTRKAMFIQTADLFKNIFAAGIAIQEITAFIYSDMIGSNGSPHKELAMKCQLKGNTAANINWNNINKTKFNQNLDYVWMVPDLRN